MTPTSNYKKFLTELIQRHMMILGPNVARDAALNISGLTIDTSGQATEISGDAQLVLEDLVDAYSALSQPIAELILIDLLKANPQIQSEYKRPLPGVTLSCPLVAKAKKGAQ